MSGTITFSTCWYIFKAKFDHETYKGWIHNMLSNVHNYNLVIYCDYSGYSYIEPYLDNPRIIVILRPVEKFYTYNYKNQWIDNHERNYLLKDKVDWKLNMLWSEKINFVMETAREKYFDTEFYGWCDIGYFRGRFCDFNPTNLKDWPSENKIKNLFKNKIYYAQVNNSNEYIEKLKTIIKDKDSRGLPNTPIPPDQVSIAGGFFLSNRDNLTWWHETYYSQLFNYFKNGYLVKDDQIIVADCIYSNPNKFNLCKENVTKYDNWFLFQRVLF